MSDMKLLDFADEGRKLRQRMAGRCWPWLHTWERWERYETGGDHSWQTAVRQRRKCVVCGKNSDRLMFMRDKSVAEEMRERREGRTGAA